MVQNILDSFLAVFALSVAFSYAMIRSYLISNGLAKYKIAYWNPISFFEKYIVHTKEQNGKTGVWFWIFIFSLAGVLLVGLTEGALELISFFKYNVKIP